MPRRPVERALLIAFSCGMGAACSAPLEAEATCVAATTRAIVNGTLEPSGLALSLSERAAVGALETSGGTVVCTATRIAPSLLLTAAHCEHGALVVFRPSAPDASTLPTSVIARHPSRDVMLMAVHEDERAVLGETPRLLANETFERAWRGGPVLIAGVGRDERGHTGTLRFAEEEVLDYDATHVAVEPTEQGGACNGDSGGPLWLTDGAGRARIAGVLSRGAVDCRGVDLYVRTDALVPWLAQQVPAETLEGEVSSPRPCP